MKTRSNRTKIPVVFAATLVSAWSAAAADMNSSGDANTRGFYLGGDAGVAILQNITIEGGVGQFNVGPRVNVSAGYNLTRNIAVELQGGFAHNDSSRVNGHSYSAGGQPVQPSGTSADIWTFPVMANGIYKYSFNNHWQAYGGAGAGAVFSTLGYAFSGVHFSSTDCEFGYQAMVGLKYLFNDHFECGLGYSFLGSLDHHYSSTLILNAPPPFPPSIVSLSSTTPTYMHSILLSLTWKF